MKVALSHVSDQFEFVAVINGGLRLKAPEKNNFLRSFRHFRCQNDGRVSRQIRTRGSLRYGNFPPFRHWSGLGFTAVAEPN